MKTTFAFALALVFLTFAPFGHAQSNYTAHEWGTFTSVQGGDGKPLWWGPFPSVELPSFVHNWSNPGLDRPPAPGFGKCNLTALQRLETPVIYFYSDGRLNVDVNVRFPEGTITEWYPQASQIVPAPSPGLASAAWNHLVIRPSHPGESFAQDSSGNHYYAARETASDAVEMNFSERAQPKTETDKFIFYRGTGAFQTPLRATVSEDGALSVANTGTEKLAHLLLISIRDGQGSFSALPELPAGQSNDSINLSASGYNSRRQPLAQFQAEIGRRMESALVSQGLFLDEAKAMVKTWTDSWFTEEGERVLYILPRAWTDGILPITFTPEPKTLVRVMVGRAEIITPSVEKNLSRLLSAAQGGDTQAQQEATAQLHKLGRFAQPALTLTANRAGVSGLAAYGSQLMAGAPPKAP